MNRITEKQRATIVRLFAGGTTIMNLSMSYELSIARIEQIIREALLRQPKSEDF